VTSARKEDAFGRGGGGDTCVEALSLGCGGHDHRAGWEIAVVSF
jgi:hypothetical protein